MQEQLGRHVYSVDGSTLEETILRLLADRRATLAVAEVATGGGLSSRLTGTPSASSILFGSYVAATNGGLKAFAGVRRVRDFGPGSRNRRGGARAGSQGDRRPPGSMGAAGGRTGKNRTPTRSSSAPDPEPGGSESNRSASGPAGRDASALSRAPLISSGEDWLNELSTGRRRQDRMNWLMRLKLAVLPGTVAPRFWRSTFRIGLGCWPSRT